MTQLALFETPAPPVYRSAKELKDERSRDPVVVAEMLAVCAAKPGEWVDIWAFYNVVTKHNVSGCIGRILCRLRDAGKVEEKNVYFGDEHLGGKNYLGFTNEYRLVEAAA